jgi:ubiquinone/menaquinone biosynthesis C-methylase UbiE
MSGHTSERADPRHYGANAEDRLIYVAHEKTYRFAAGFVAGKRVLDLGCGVGYGARLLSEQAAQVVGVDVSAEALTAAQAEHSAPNLRFENVPLDSPHLPFADQSVDVVTCFHVLEHVAAESALMSEMARIVAPDGVVLLSTPNARFRLLPFQNPWNRFHVREHTEKSLRSLVGREFAETAWLGITLREPWLQFERKRSVRYALVLWPITNRLVPWPARRRLLSMAARVGAMVKRRVSAGGSAAEAAPTLADVLIRSTGIGECPTLLVLASHRPRPQAGGADSGSLSER